MTKKDNTILIVDDNSNNLKVVSGVLKEVGYNLRMAKSGRQALGVLDKTVPDLILLDIQMPEMDGFETCLKIKENELLTQIPIIFLTANTDAKSISKAFEVGGVDFVTKPFNSSELLARIETHIKLKTQTEELVYQNKTKDKFFSIISHDLKNPLSAVIGFSELLEESFDQLEHKDVKKFIHYIHESSKFSIEILNNLLDWSRMQRGNLRSEKTNYNLSSLLNSNIEGHMPQASAKKIKFDLDIDEDLIVCADEKMISTVIRNLISNAIKFTPNGGEIFISSKQKFINDKKVVETEIKDTGVGMSYEKINKLFKIEHNVVSKGTNNESGTGLGLLLCKEFISQNNGNIKVESELEIGSKFIFDLNCSS
ncbi:MULTISPECIES: hybrid sensor histidine kinase/response regulator [Flavobacteriaceae]|uniref:histidine kinase n=2 Tax=Flavobacteriaceae TaxID=49546 RepID=A0A4Y8ARY4_9FLAO|nr:MULTISPECIES: hybrid sensor histidine kinase/response regulator [Flavobacteriaceae]TEW73137.1 hybrid sensor histidine kinase/response regulator [Gramella jeungdoensis]GGK46730.1 hybrid sensor histidine kinase/response regulator [Lutibacter litoralis]